MPILNIAAYRFVALGEPARWVPALREHAGALDLKGTVIVADEGINLFLAGREQQVQAFVAWLADDPRFVDRDGKAAFVALPIRRTWSTHVPFRRLRVRHRPEIVTMRQPSIRPARTRAPAVAPERLAAWLAQGHDDEGRPIALLDARNAFEVAHGTFDGARHLGLDRFDGFADAVDRARDTFGADETIVTFCTGGIRCEKAALRLGAAGLTHVWQLDGGILGYFERVGDAHWRGDCFVFDERVALAPPPAGSVVGE